MSKLQNKLFAKLQTVLEIGQKLLLDVKVCEEELTSLVDYALVKVGKLRSQLKKNAKDHGKTLKPAHLSYKCTVCTATFGQYKLFENHVYTAHSGVAKKADKNKQVRSMI